MAGYAYKAVVFRDDFQAMIPRYEAEDAVAFEGDANYDGDCWYVVEMLLDEKDAEIARLRALVESRPPEGEEERP